jgi:hypothetical protein
MVVGDNQLFPYRSSHFISEFFEMCGLPFRHDGSSRARWPADRLSELNDGPPTSTGLPSRDLVTVIIALFDPYRFDQESKDPGAALEALNVLLKRTGIVAGLDQAGRCHLTNTGTGAVTSTLPQPRPLTRGETERREKLAAFLDSASEDELTEKMLVPFFLRLGFHRVSVTGHKEKILEFGRDLWTKLQLPTGHWIYFCAQIKREKIDSSGAGKGNNVATVLNQALMALGHPIFDPDTNRKVLLDHLYIISAGEITKAAREWLVGQLDTSMRRHIVFMDRSEFLDNAARILLDLRLDQPAAPTAFLDDDVPF